jgi:hypothetical protein
MHPVRTMNAASNVFVPVCVSISSIDFTARALAVRQLMLKKVEDEAT